MKITAPRPNPSRKSKASTGYALHSPASRPDSLSSPEAVLFEDMRHEAVSQRRLQTLVDNSRQQRSRACNEMPNNSVQARRVTQLQVIANAHAAYATVHAEYADSDRTVPQAGRQSNAGVVQRSLLKDVLKKKTVDASGLKVTGTKPPDETAITCWKGRDEEGMHSAMWFSYTGEGEDTVLGKIEWTGDGFRVIYGAKIDKYYKDPPDEPAVSTIGKMLSGAKEHIDQVKGEPLLSHCHEFVDSLYQRL